MSGSFRRQSFIFPLVFLLPMPAIYILFPGTWVSAIRSLSFPILFELKTCLLVLALICPRFIQHGAWYDQWFPSGFPSICSSLPGLGIPSRTELRSCKHPGTDMVGSSMPPTMMYNSGHPRGGESLVASRHSLSASRFGSVPVSLGPFV